MASQHLLSTKSVGGPTPSALLGRSRPGAAGLAHLVCMTTTTQPEPTLGPVLTLSQLATQLGVGRHVKFIQSDVLAWIEAQREVRPGGHRDGR